MKKQKGSSRTPCQGSAGSPVDLPCRSRTGRPSPSSQELCPQHGRVWGHQAVILSCWQNLKSLVWKQGPIPSVSSVSASVQAPYPCPGPDPFLALSLAVGGCSAAAGCLEEGTASSGCSARLCRTDDRIAPSEPRTTFFPHPIAVLMHYQHSGLASYGCSHCFKVLLNPTAPYSCPQHRSKSPVFPNYYGSL